MANSGVDEAWQPSSLFQAAISSSAIAAHAVDFIVDKAAGVLYEKYLAERALAYTTQSVWHDMVSSVGIMMLKHDAGEIKSHDDASTPAANGFSDTAYAAQGPNHAQSSGMWICEEEPDPGLIDSWARAAVPTLSSAPARVVRESNSATTPTPGRSTAAHSRRPSGKAPMVSPSAAGSPADAAFASADRPYSPGMEGALLQLQLDIPERPSSSLGNVTGTTAQSSMEATRKVALESMRRKEAAAAAEAAAAERVRLEAADAAKRLTKQLKGQKYTTDETGQVIVIQSVASAGRALHGAAPVQVSVRDNTTGESVTLGGLPTAGEPMGAPPVGLAAQASVSSQLSGRSGVLPPTASAAAWEEVFAHPPPGKNAPPPPRMYATLQSPPGTTAATTSFFKEKPTVSALLVDDSVELAPGVEAREGRRRAAAKPQPKSDKNMSRAEYSSMACILAASTRGIGTAERLRSRGGGSARGGGRRAEAMAKPHAQAPNGSAQASGSHSNLPTASMEGKASLDTPVAPPSGVTAGGSGMSSLLPDDTSSVSQPRGARQGRRAGGGAHAQAGASMGSLSGEQGAASSARSFPQPAARPAFTADPASRAAVVGQGRRLPRDRAPVRTATMQRTIEREIEEAALAQGVDAARIRAVAAQRVSGLQAKVKASGVANPRRPGETPPMELHASSGPCRSKLHSGVPIISNEQLERRGHATAPLVGQVSRLGGSASSSALAAAGAATLLRGGTPNVYGEEHLRKRNVGRLSSTPNAQVALGL